jgi:tetratricopeptide (TPR) repeat protein
MTDEPDDHEFSSGQGYDDPYEGFDLEPPEFEVDPDQVDPVDSRVVTDLLDQRTLAAEEVDAEELLDVGLSYMRINRFEQATEAFERTANFAEDERVEQEAWTNKGVAHAELEEWDAAVGAYREALTDDDSEAQRASNASSETASSEHAATAETNLAYALWESGRTEQALEHAERAVEIDPRFAEAWYNRGFFLLERGLAEDANEAFDNAIRLGFRNSEILEEKARALEELGEYDRAEELVDEADELRQEAEAEMLE